MMERRVQEVFAERGISQDIKRFQAVKREVFKVKILKGLKLSSQLHIFTFLFFEHTVNTTCGTDFSG